MYDPAKKELRVFKEGQTHAIMEAFSSYRSIKEVRDIFM